jgi:apolipoprotein N-acyltransferase
MSLLKNIGIASLTGILLGLSWQPNFFWLAFIAWVPLLFVSETSSKKMVLISYISFLIWNVIVTWWVWYASNGASILMLMANSLLMCITFMLYYRTRQRINSYKAMWLLPAFWLSFEYLHQYWDLAWVWLNQGNIFANATSTIQWYEYTGSSGGSLWILLVNILITRMIILINEKKVWWKNAMLATCLIAIPIIISISFLAKPFYKITGNLNLNQALIVQPNADPYNYKFEASPEEQLAALEEQIKDQVNNNTKYLILPETYLTENIWEGTQDSSYSLQFLRKRLLEKYPNLTVVTGCTSFYQFKKDEALSITAREFNNLEGYFDVFNAALQLDNTNKTQFYHKSILVPGVERMPFPALLKPLEKVALDLGGTTGSLGTQKERSLLYHKDGYYKVAPIICYESVHSEYVSEYVKKGANLLFIITNDGWWDNTPGHIQHLDYAKLRAIETRRYIYRSANTGISAEIDEYGNILQQTPWWQPATLTVYLKPLDTITFFVKHGDYLSRTAVLIALFSFVFYLSQQLLLRWNANRQRHNK